MPTQIDISPRISVATYETARYWAIVLGLAHRREQDHFKVFVAPEGKKGKYLDPKVEIRHEAELITSFYVDEGYQHDCWTLFKPQDDMPQLYLANINPGYSEMVDGTALLRTIKEVVCPDKPIKGTALMGSGARKRELSHQYCEALHGETFQGHWYGQFTFNYAGRSE